jgi:hypothetical protein
MSNLMLFCCSISWEYNIVGEISLEEYEDTRPVRRSQMEMVLPRKVRFDMLRLEWDVSRSEIADTVRRNVKTKNQRRTTVNNLGKAPKMEQVMERLGRKVRRTLLGQKPVSRQVQILDAKFNEVVRLRKQYALELEMADEYDSSRAHVDEKTEEPLNDEETEEPVHDEKTEETACDEKIEETAHCEKKEETAQDEKTEETGYDEKTVETALDEMTEETGYAS